MRGRQGIGGNRYRPQAVDQLDTRQLILGGHHVEFPGAWRVDILRQLHHGIAHGHHHQRPSPQVVLPDKSRSMPAAIGYLVNIKYKIGFSPQHEFVIMRIETKLLKGRCHRGTEQRDRLNLSRLQRGRQVERQFLLELSGQSGDVGGRVFGRLWMLETRVRILLIDFAAWKCQVPRKGPQMGLAPDYKHLVPADQDRRNSVYHIAHPMEPCLNKAGASLTDAPASGGINFEGV